MMDLVSNSTQKWTMVLARNLAADGTFVYAVKSTGIFCRPSCPSRRPRRDQVEFFKSPAEAQQAGYRPCHRCRPQQRNLHAEKVRSACRYIEEHLDNTLHLDDLARHVGVSPFHFQRLFKRTLGISPREYQQARRAEKFRSGLRSAARVTDAIYDAGYSSSSRAYETSAAQFGMTPSALQRGGEGAEIDFTIVKTNLGSLLIAATARGICSVRFGESEAELVRDLQREFVAATLKRSDQKLQRLSSDVCALLDDAFISRDIPIDIRGTAFQQQVWNALRRIPPGETRSYAAIAEAIGKPKAVRAVANACAANPVAVVIPCHRVVQKGGSLAGYRWGVKRKAALLKNEQQHNRVRSNT